MKTQYETPSVADLGSFEEITQASFSGTRGDFRAALNVEQPILS